MSSDLSPDMIKKQLAQLGGSIGLLLAGLLLIYVVYSGIYTVAAYEQAVVMRFGRHHRTVGPGLHFKMPWIEKRVLVVTSDRSLRLPYGVSEDSDSTSRTMIDREGQNDLLILTGDLYAAVVEWNVRYRVTEPEKYLFHINAEQVEDVIIEVARTSMNRIVGDYSAEEVLTGKRAEVTVAATEEMQRELDQYECGVEIVELQMQRVIPPERVKPSFDAVNASIQQRDQLINEARRTENEVIPQAEAEADKLIREAEGYASRELAEVEGEIAALRAKYRSYKDAPDVTRQRMYLETMEKVMQSSGPKTILDGDVKGLLPLLNLSPSESP
jgi:membrane protease subunit HflK